MLIDLAKMAKIHKFGLANSLVDSPMATCLTLRGTMMTNDIDRQSVLISKTLQLFRAFNQAGSVGMLF